MTRHNGNGSHPPSKAAPPISRVLRLELIAGAGMLIPGAPNALTARVAEEVGFPALLVTGAGIANTYLGVPDIGLVTLSELVNHVTAIREAVDIPLIADADTGFGIRLMSVVQLNCLSVPAPTRLCSRIRPSQSVAAISMVNP